LLTTVRISDHKSNNEHTADRFLKPLNRSMGRGGEKIVVPSSKFLHAKGHSGVAGDVFLKDTTSTVSSSIRPSASLEGMPTEELRKAAMRYGHNASTDRAELLQELVSGERRGDLLAHVEFQGPGAT
jgi:hypothetical protein